jgi:hypothetical protein
MTVHVISVGRSLLDTFTSGERLKNLPADVAKAISQERPQDMLVDAQAAENGEVASDWLAGVLTSGNLRDSLFAAMVRAIRPGIWPARVSAELDTFSRVKDAAIPLSAADTAVLVCSDTPEGILAGLWNATALAGGDLERIRYLPDPAGPLGSVRGKALVARVKGLDASSESDFMEAMSGLGTLGRHLLDSPAVSPADAFRFYLSGGFKAAIPYLIGLAEGLRSTSGTRKVDAYVLHETGRSGAIRLPLRRMIAAQVAEELAGFEGQPALRKELPCPALLYGYAYDRKGKSYELTPFGEGLRALFPPPHERPNP